MSIRAVVELDKTNPSRYQGVALPVAREYLSPSPTHPTEVYTDSSEALITSIYAHLSIPIHQPTIKHVHERFEQRISFPSTHRISKVKF